MDNLQMQVQLFSVNVEQKFIQVKNVGRGGDDTLFALVSGIVKYERFDEYKKQIIANMINIILPKQIKYALGKEIINLESSIKNLNSKLSSFIEEMINDFKSKSTNQTEQTTNKNEKFTFTEKFDDLTMAYNMLNLNAIAYEQTKELIKIPSYKTDALPKAPFGQGTKDVLDYAINLSKELGFETYQDPENRYGFLDYGNGDELFVILCHLDVVPPGNMENE
ncbi:hypothetical protein FQA39_LY12832 [Lamprigera yunnana]|nr:hypothetical protein FQA39_LY12832 [Lamprigera yunnana]